MTAPSTTVRPPSLATDATAAERPHATDHPGRWLGGAIGAALSLGLVAISRIVEPDGFVRGPTTLATLGLLGTPIGFVIGRHFFPQARGQHWQDALLVGIGLGWLAPPLGALEIVGGQLLTAVEAGSRLDASWLLILVLAVPVSFVAVLVTMPVGIAWGLIVHAIPAGLPARLRVPAPVERLGVRHAIALTTLLLLVDHLPGDMLP